MTNATKTDRLWEIMPDEVSRLRPLFDNIAQAVFELAQYEEEEGVITAEEISKQFGDLVPRDRREQVHASVIAVAVGLYVFDDGSVYSLDEMYWSDLSLCRDHCEKGGEDERGYPLPDGWDEDDEEECY